MHLVFLPYITIVHCCFLIALTPVNCHEMSPVWCKSEVACHCLRLYCSLIHLFQALIWALESAAAKKRLLFTLIHRDNTMAKAQAPWEAVAVCHTWYTQVPCRTHSLSGSQTKGSYPTVKALGQEQMSLREWIKSAYRFVCGCIYACLPYEYVH